MNEEQIETPIEATLMSPEEVDAFIWTKLLEWVNGDSTLPPDIKDMFVERADGLRLRMQALFLEIQRRLITQVAAEAEFEEELRRNIRADIPYMGAKEKLEALKTLTASFEDRLKRLEAQVAGFDFFHNVQVSIQTLSDTKVSKDLAQTVKQMPSARRQQLLSMLNNIIAEVNAVEKPKELNGTTNIILDVEAGDGKPSESE